MFFVLSNCCTRLTPSPNSLGPLRPLFGVLGVGHPVANLRPPEPSWHILNFLGLLEILGAPYYVVILGSLGPSWALMCTIFKAPLERFCAFHLALIGDKGKLNHSVARRILGVSDLTSFSAPMIVPVPDRRVDLFLPGQNSIK